MDYGLAHDCGEKARDLQIKKMKFRIKRRTLRAVQSSIDVALWVVVDLIDENFDHKRKTWLRTYLCGRCFTRWLSTCAESDQGGDFAALENKNRR